MIDFTNTRVEARKAFEPTLMMSGEQALSLESERYRKANRWWKQLCSTFGSFAFFTSLRSFVIRLRVVWRKNRNERTHEALFIGAPTKEKRKMKKIKNLLGTIMKCFQLFFFYLFSQPKMRTKYEKWNFYKIAFVDFLFFFLFTRNFFSHPQKKQT